MNAARQRRNQSGARPSWAPRLRTARGSGGCTHAHSCADALRPGRPRSGIGNGEHKWSLFGAGCEVLSPYYNQDVSGADDKDLECGDLSPLLRFADESAKQSRVQRRGKTPTSVRRRQVACRKRRELAALHIPAVAAQSMLGDPYRPKKESCQAAKISSPDRTAPICVRMRCGLEVRAPFGLRHRRAKFIRG